MTNNTTSNPESTAPQKDMGQFVSELLDRINELEAERDVLGHIIRRRAGWTKRFAAECIAIHQGHQADSEFASQTEGSLMLERHWETFVKNIPDQGEKWCAYCGITSDHSSGGCMRLLHDRNAALENQNKALLRRLQQITSKIK
jgi:hypothetical protein